jgi:DegV family protein with EDD domain
MGAVAVPDAPDGRPDVTVRVITDSAATLPPAVADGLEVVTVPFRIDVDGTTLLDGTVSDEELLSSTGTVTTSGPAPEDFLTALAQHGSADGNIILTVSHDIAAGTHLAARAAAAEADRPVHVVDTRTAAGAEGLVVLAAARLAAAGAALERVEAEARRVIDRVRLVATVPDLDHLSRSGHVPEAAVWATRWIGLQPCFEFRGGKVRAMRPALSAGAADARLLEAWRSTRPDGETALHLAVLHALDPERAESLLDVVRAEVQPAEEFTGSFGTVMTLHTGPGVVGLAWWWDETGRGSSLR